MHKEYVYRFLLSLKAMGLVLMAAQTAFAQATGPFNVRSYGASGASNCTLVSPGVSVDQAGFNAALAAVPASGGEIYVPAGSYCMTHPLWVTGKSIAFRGEGQKLSILRWDTASNGIVYNGTSKEHSLTVKSLSFVKGSGLNGVAIWGYWNVRSESSVASITDVAISHDVPTYGTGWSYGIHLLHAGNPMIHHFDFINGIDDGIAILFAGQTIHANVTKGSIIRAADGIKMIDNSEGLHVTDVEIVAAKRGIVIDSPWDLPGTSISNNHLNTSEKGIHILSHGDVGISNNLLYSTANATNYKGIHVVNSDSLRITGNQIVRTGPTSTNLNGIVIEGTSPRNVIANNVTDGMDTGIWLAGINVIQNLVIGNINRNYGVASVLDWGPAPPNVNQNNLASNY